METMAQPQKAVPLQPSFLVQITPMGQTCMGRRCMGRRVCRLPALATPLTIAVHSHHQQLHM